MVLEQGRHGLMAVRKVLIKAYSDELSSSIDS